MGTRSSSCLCLCLCNVYVSPHIIKVCLVVCYFCLVPPSHVISLDHSQIQLNAHTHNQSTMGNSVSSAVKKMEQQQDEAEAQMKQELAQLSATLKAKEEEFKMSLIAPDAANKLLPIDTIVKMDSKQQVDVSTAPSEKMNAMIEDMFGGNFLKALKGLILGALDAVLGNASAGEKESSGMACILMHSAIVRVDYFVYAYTLRSDGAKTHLQNGLVFAVSMSTIKLEAVNSEVIALLSGLTAENSVSFVNNLANKFNLFADNVARNPIAYTSADCIGYIRGYFYDNMDDTQHTDFEKLEKQANKNGDDGNPDEAARADAREQLNKMFASVAREFGIEKSTTSQITDLQEQLLDQMIKIYDKINEMKRSTAASIDGITAPRITA